MKQVKQMKQVKHKSSRVCSTTKGVATDSGDHGRLDASNAIPGPEATAHHIDGRLARHFFDVGPGGEGPITCARDDYAANLLIVVKGFQGVCELAHRVEIEGVEFLGTIERDDAHTLVAIYENVLVVWHNSPCLR